MEIQEQQHGAVTVVRPNGPLNQNDAEQFDKRLSAAVSSSLGRLVVDASAVPFTDSQGLESLVNCSETMSESGQALRLCGTGPTVRQAIELTGLADRFEFFEDANQAVRSFL